MSYKDNIAAIFGIKQLQTILEIKPEYVTNIKKNVFEGLSQETVASEESINIDEVQIDLSEDSNDAETDSKDESITSSQKSQGHKNQVDPIEFTGFISSCAHGSGRSSTDRQFYYVNSRPCEPTKVTKLINEIYKQYNSNQYPFVFLNVNMERTSVDVNVTPDKRKIFLTKEKIVLDVLKNSLLKLFESIPRTIKLENNICSKETNDKVKSELEMPRINNFLKQFSKTANYGSSSESKNTCNLNETNSAELKRKSTTMLDFISAKVSKRQSYEVEDDDFSYQEIKQQDNEVREDNCISIPKDHVNQEHNDDSVSTENDRSIVEDDNIATLREEKESPEVNKKDVLYLEFTDNVPNTQIRNLTDVIIEKSHTITCKVKTPNSKATVSKVSDERPAKKAKIVTDQEDTGKYNRRTVNLKTSLEHVKMLTDIYNKQKTKTAPERIKFKSAINPVFNKKCEDELSKEISKDSFKQMSVVGQFNLGFIITKLDDDLFIIDQHATDEIYNFETLQKTTELTSQKLVMYVFA